MCQSPSRRGTHFYEAKRNEKGIYQIVSIPFTSGNSFLQKTKAKASSHIPCVNPLHVGELISTCPTPSAQHLVGKVCQSPSHRGTHFYFPQKAPGMLNWMCQSPSRRGTHFYGGIRKTRWPLLVVSIPFTSGNSFLPSPLFFVEFMRVSSLDFRGIFQTILKTAVFSVASTFLSIFYKRADFKGHAFLQILVFSACPGIFISIPRLRISHTV